jgi:chromosome segregation ATPase
VHQQTDSSDAHSVHQIVDDLLGERIEALAGWIQELDAQVRATAASGDEKTLKELRRVLDAWSKRDPKFEERLTDRVDVLADRLTTLSSTVNTTAAALAGNEGELAALRRQLEDGMARVEAALRRPDVGGVAHGELDELRKLVSSLSADRPTRKGDRRVDGLSETVDNLSERLDTLAKTVATTAAGLAGREGELAALRRSLEDEHGLVENVVAHLRDAEEPADSTVETRVEELAGRVEAATAGLARSDREVATLRAGVGEGQAAITTLATELRGALGTLAANVGALEQASAADDRTDDVVRRLDSLTTTVDELGSRLETVSNAAASASSSFAVQELELAALHRQLTDASSRVDGALGELREMLAELPDPAAAEAALEGRLEDMLGLIDAQANRLRGANARAETVAKELRSSVSELFAKVVALEESSGRDERSDALEQQLETTAGDVLRLRGQIEALVSGVASASSGVAAQELELAAFRSHVADASARFDQVLADLRSAVDAQPDSAEALVALDARVDQVADATSSLARDIANVATGVESATSGVDARRLELSELRDQVSEASARFERRLAALQEAFEERPDPTAMVAELHARVEHATERVDTISHRLAESDEAAAERIAVALSQTAHVESTLSLAAARLEALERSGRVAAAELAQLSGSRAEEHAWVREELDTLGTAVAQMPGSQTLEQLRADLSGRLDGLETARESLAAETVERLEALERKSAAAASHLARTDASWSSSLEVIEARLDELAARPAATPPSQDEELERLLVAFADRIEAMEGDRTLIADEFAAASSEGVGQLRTLVERLETRVAASEKEIAVLATRDLTEAVEKLGARLETLEKTTLTLVPPTSAPSVGDGRLRVELRALELRAEHAEAAARENREAVLVELERLASSVEQRLQRLETPRASTDAAEPAAPTPLGQVVPIRTSAEP